LNHVWPENYSVNSAQKVWGAAFAAHHPNVAVLDLSSFKCGHDAPTYGLIADILQTSKTPSAALHDLDANKPGGSIKIRVKTYAHSLRLQQERLEDLAMKKRELARRIDEKRLELLQLRQAQLEGMRQKDPALEKSIAELAGKVRAYEAPALAPEPPKAMLKLGRKLADGSIQRIDTTPVAAPTAAE
ncbi:MAG TPA: CoA activase, partial [Polyangiaceae bacterium]|nr:CoA activase [Polyangiaceae bacterium]